MGNNKFKPRLSAVLTLLVLFAGTVFTVHAFLGDINLDDQVNAADLDLVRQAFGSNEWTSPPNWNPFADLDINRKVDVMDLAIAGRSYGFTIAFHFPRRISNFSSVNEVASCIDGLDRVNIVYRTSGISVDKTYFTRLDRFGNTLIDDVWLDTESSTPSVAVGCDDAGNAHVIWECSDGICQARFDPWGYMVISPSVAYDKDTSGQLAIDLDSQGNPHAFFRRFSQNVQTYARFNTDGELMLTSQGLLSGSSTITIYHDIALDTHDNVHLMWYELIDDDRVYYARLSTEETPAIPDTIIGYTDYDGIINASREPAMALDPDSNAFILYPNADVDKLLLDKIDPDGNFLLNDHEIFPQWQVGGYTPKSELAIDQHGNLHLFSITDWGKGLEHSAYGSFSNDATPLYPMRWALYGAPPSEPNILVDSQDDIHFVYRRGLSSTSYPSCPSSSACYQGTAFDPNAYDLTRSDLGIDAAHLSWEPLIARWNQPIVITGTVFNAGWVTSTLTTLDIDITTMTGTVLGPPAHAELVINPLVPHQTHIFTATLTLPYTPPEGMEELEYLRLLLELDPTHTQTETTQDNNRLSAPILVQKLPTETGLFLIVIDDTNSARGGEGESVNTGTAGIEGKGYSTGEILVTDYVTLLAEDIPVTGSVVTYTIGWEGNGYTTPAKSEIGLARNSTDPYIIDYNPSNTAVLVTDRWGSLSGVISKSDGGGGALEGVTVRLVGKGLSIEATTDVNGAYSYSTTPALAKLIPGEYTLRLSRADYARHTETLTLAPLEEKIFNKTLEPTKDAYLHGNVINNFGNPVVNAEVYACGLTASTDSQGVFDLEVDATCTELEITQTYYAPLNEPISLTAGLELILDDLTMYFDPPLNVFSDSNKVGSRIIDVSSGGLLPEPPEDANWLQKQVYEQFKSKFWAEYRIVVVYGGYAYNAAAGYSGGPGDYHMSYIEVNFIPKTFEVHMLLTTVTIGGVPIPLPLVDDSGETTAIRVIEARLVNTSNGQVIETIEKPEPEEISEIITADTTLKYNFASYPISDWANTEVWLYYKIGKNVGGFFVPMTGQLYQCDRQIMKFDLSTGEIWIDYGLGPFPLE
ncbi:MAG: hypothetical protein JXB38_12925 [Anaerolineales bacterium]|nr:hypothetical protein [Anaerolineales bacterium]